MKTRFILALVGFAFTTPAYSQAQEAASPPLPEQQIREVATRIVQKAHKANCRAPGCKILVANFTLPSGLTSLLGLQLADQFSKELASPQGAIQIIDRSDLRVYLEQERIPGAFLINEKAMRWLGKQLGSTAVLTGFIEDKGSALRIKIRLLSCDKGKASAEEQLIISSSDLRSSLAPSEAFPQKLPDDAKPADSPTFRAGVGGVTQPACTYCPEPDFTEAASKASFNGPVVMDVSVSPEGQAMEVTILRGAPFGLNAAAMRAVHRWKFKPATFNGKPVPVKVVVEINMHSF